MRRVRRTIVILALLVVSGLWPCGFVGEIASPSFAEPATARAADEPSRDPSTGSVAGAIRYRYDSARWWRYGRYYVNGPREGEFAEAVVALAGANLKTERTGDVATATIDQKDFRFVPETVAVRVGDRVRFTNSDREVHNVSSLGKLQPFDVSLRMGTESIVPFDRAGNLTRPAFVGCKFHSAMHAWIYVFDHPYYAVTATDGRYRLDGVPPGEHRLEIQHPAGGLRVTKTVTVAAGKTTTLDVTLTPDDLVAR